MEITSAILILLIAFGLLIVLFLICREIVCWYYKINLRVKLQTESFQQLKLITEKLTARKTCKYCGLVNESNTHFCPGCDKDNEGLLKEDYKNRARLNRDPGTEQ